MTQDERWLARYNEVKTFIEENHRNPSKYVDSERGLRNWVKQQRKLKNKGELKAGEMKSERIEPFKKLLELCGRYRHKNQYE